MASPVTRLRTAPNPSEWGETKAGRVLQSIRRDMDLKGAVFRNRLRNEEILSVIYQDGGLGGDSSHMGGGPDWERIREDALNLPYRYVRWLESQAVSERLLVKVNRNAGAGQVPGGPGDEETGMWVGISLERVAEEGGIRRELRALISEVFARGTSVLRIGYHREEVTPEEAQEAGKDVQSVVADVLGGGDVEAKSGQDHHELSEGLGAIAQDPVFQDVAGMDGIHAVLTRKASHDDEARKAEVAASEQPIERVRETHGRLWVRKLRVAEDVGWAPWVYDTEDSPFWWERHVWTVAEVRRSDLFTTKFKRSVQGFDARDASGVAQGGKVPATDSMSSDARIAQGEDVLDEDERLVEWYSVWMRRPEMRSGGVRKIVAPEMPGEWVESDESNPHVDRTGKPLIPGFYPFYDFTPVQSSLPVPERTLGVPPIAVGMTQFEKIAEYNRIKHDGVLRAVRVFQMHPDLKDNKRLADALKNGENGYSFFAPSTAVDQDGKMKEAVIALQFSGDLPEIGREINSEKGDWVQVMGMPPAVLQGVGTAETATQDAQGIAAGERESGALIAYLKGRLGDVFSGLRGLMRGTYDDEDFIALLGEEGAAVMKAWQEGSTDAGDRIEVEFGMHAMARETVEKKQLMEAITLLRALVEPVTGLEKYDVGPLVEELTRRLGVGRPKVSDGPMRQLQEMVLQLMQQVQAQAPAGGGERPPGGARRPAPGGGRAPPRGGPNPSEGDGPTEGTLASGASRGTFPPAPRGA